jgi:hypothetical protein
MLQSEGAREDNNQEYAQIMQYLKNLQDQQQTRSNPTAPPTSNGSGKKKSHFTD